MKRIMVGIDEVGRGPLAGPLTVCGVARIGSLPRGFWRGIKDSKKLSERDRSVWVARARRARARGEIIYVLASITPGVIDRIGMSASLTRAVTRILSRLPADPATTHVLLDGSLYAPSHYKHQKTIIKGDEKEPLIALASIIAKVHRDAYMVRMAKRFPAYGFEKHKGYGTREHLDALAEHGISVIHRKSFVRFGKGGTI